MRGGRDFRNTASLGSSKLEQSEVKERVGSYSVGEGDMTLR